tara:strand:- start:117 stop:470 length:354 start_codon:yes stop_codon:yes gene_type:complete
MSRRFSADSVQFCQLWNAIIKDDVSPNAWNKFVSMCWDKFSPHNKEMLDETESGWEKWSNDEIQVYYGEKAYTKMTLLRKKFKSMGKEIEYPNGYLNRGGKKASKRTSTEDLMSLFD